MATEAQWWCYGIAQGERLRVANRFLRGLPLSKYHQSVIDNLGIGDPGEHVSALSRVIVGLRGFGVDCNDLDDIMDALIDRINGVLIEDLRHEAIQRFKTRDPVMIAGVIKSLQANGIEIDLAAGVGETSKP